jgi:pimeloyl-ACP methyl ester carboxylesterase
VNSELERWRAKGSAFDFLGFEVFYVIEGSGPHLLLVHGYPFNSFDWVKIWPPLTERFTVIAPDMLGMGFSDKPEQYEYSVHAHADMHEALLAHLGVERCRILAHDIGVSVVQEMLTRHDHGEQSSGHFTIQSIAWLNGGLFYEAYRPRPIQKLLSASPLGDVFARALSSPLGGPMLQRAVGEMFGPETKPSAELRAQFQEIMDFKDGRKVTHKVGRFVVDRYHHRNRWVAAMRTTGVPMRLINGPLDPNSGAHMAKRYGEVIPNPDVVILGEKIGHWPQIEAPDDVVRHFLAFAEKP